LREEKEWRLVFLFYTNFSMHELCYTQIWSKKPLCFC
jgi:hypothetical protein